jgi:hypothetical protein
MKYLLLITLTILTFPSIGQEIEKIIFTSQQADEPPTKQGRPKYAITFKRQSNGDLVAADYYEKSKKKKLKNKMTIDKNQLEKFKEWGTNDKELFTQSDLGLDIQTLRNKASNQKLNFEIPTDLTVKVDSFQFCQPYKMTWTSTTGGQTISVTIALSKRDQGTFVFTSGDMGVGEFKLKDYILCYILLKDKIPTEIPYSDFFSISKLEDVILFYQKTVECEGYYYKEYTDKNPQMTPQDRRMMKGWNFAEYLRQRNKKE